MKRFKFLAILMVMVCAAGLAANAAAISITYQHPNYPMDQSEAYRAFMKQYPKARFRKIESMGAGHLFLQEQLVNQNKRMDVYYTQVMDNSLQSILSKGYYVPLQDETEIAQFIKGMAPALQRAVKTGDDISQVPVEVFMPYVFLMNPELRDTIGLRPDEMPATFFELLDFAQAWPETYGVNHPDITPLYIRAGDPLVNIRNYTATFVLRAYLYSMVAAQEEVRFDTPLFRSLLEAIAPLTRSSSETKMLLDQDNIMFDTPQWHQCVFYVVWSSSPFYSPRMELLQPLPLTAGSPIVQPISLTTAHLNPYGKNKDDALLWLSYQAKYPDPFVARTLGLVDAPLEYPELDKSKPLTDMERYRITPAQIVQYQERVMPHLLVCGQSPAEAPGFLIQAENLFAQYLDGALPEELFIQQLDNIIKLIEQEGIS